MTNNVQNHEKTTFNAFTATPTLQIYIAKYENCEIRLRIAE